MKDSASSSSPSETAILKGFKEKCENCFKIFTVQQRKMNDVYY